mmetsp:Transcript_39174/g.87596  ORF Transcript_39174/g.87596 Transcript_39174/m.87596 type:complete len:217 (-) Transcript_39174:225-875(-)
MGRKQAREGGDHDEALRAEAAALRGEPLRLLRAAQNLQLVSEPLDQAAAHHHGPLQAVDRRLALELVGHRRQEAVPGRHRFGTRVHHDEAARAVGALGVPLLEAGLPHQGGVLVAQDARHSNAPEPALLGAHAVHFRTRLDLWEPSAREVEGIEELLVPIQRLEVEEERSARVGHVGHVSLAAAQLPHQPAVHRAEQRLFCLGLAAQALDILEEPH